MATADQYRTKAIEYANLLKAASCEDEERELRKLERSFSELADNAEWMADNQSKIVQSKIVQRSQSRPQE